MKIISKDGLTTVYDSNGNDISEMISEIHFDQVGDNIRCSIELNIVELKSLSNEGQISMALFQGKRVKTVEFHDGTIQSFEDL